MLQLIKRYRYFFLIVTAIFAVQIFLAYKSLRIPLDSPNYSKLVKKKNTKTLNSKKIAVKNIIDDEDIINSNTFNQQHNQLYKKNGNPKEKLDPIANLNFEPACNISGMKETVSAVIRAKTDKCKKEIIDVACNIKAGFYPETLSNNCPNGNYIANRSLGCYKDDKKNRLLTGYYATYKDSNCVIKCIQICVQYGYMYAGVQYRTECFCGNTEPDPIFKIPDPNCNMKCPADPKATCGGNFSMNLYETGINFKPRIAEQSPKQNEKRARIVFMLTLNGRALRQVYRLLKSIYSVDHYYYIHIDSRQDYLFRELSHLEAIFPNIRLAQTRFSTIWGGASLLKMLMTCMSDLLKSDWEWDFILNLSESDFPIKTIDKLTDFLTANKDKNFVKSHGRETYRFIQKQGLDKSFVECDTHMWKIGDRNLPKGIQIDGGSDWFCLSRNFVKYVTDPNQDKLIEGLLRIFHHTLLAAESFFHTAIRNSHFCDTYVDNNLHITNWQRKLGCKCQHKHVVDWCGCSPNDFKTDDWPRLQATEPKQIFFGRKFEPVINQLVILQLEEWLYGPYLNDYPNLNSYWQNIYHHMDINQDSSKTLLTIANSLIRINSQSNTIHQFYKPLKIIEVIDYWDSDVYRGFLIKHEAQINVNLTVELESWCKPIHLAQVSKSVKLSKKVMQLDVSTDFDQKELLSRNNIKVIGRKSDVLLILKLAASPGIDNGTLNLTVLWYDPNNKLVDSGNLIINDLSSTSVNFSKSSLKTPMEIGIWTVKVLQQRSLLGVTKFLIVPDHIDTKESIISEPNDIKEKLISQNRYIDSLITNFYVIKETCILYSQKNIRDIVSNYLNVDITDKNFYKFTDCKKTEWSSHSPDPKSDLQL